MARDKGTMQAHMVAAVIVGGAGLFAFCIYLVVVFFGWLSDNPEILAYTFGLAATIQAWWLAFAWAKRRFHTPGPDAAIKPPGTRRQVQESS